MTITKGANQTSEQTFRIGINFSYIFFSPGVVNSATLQSTNPTESYDFSFGSPGSNTTTDIIPEQQFVQVPFFLSTDDLSEGLEGFLLTVTVAGMDLGFPSFQTANTTLFTSSLITIVDDDRKYTQLCVAGY